MSNDLERLSNAAENISLDERSLDLRKLIVRAIECAGRGHIGGALSCVEILRVLYDDIMNYQASDPKWDKRDRLIFSKGHGCLALYSILADKGFFEKSHLDTCFKKDSILGGHPERGKVPGVEASTGALAHGLAIGVGISLASKIKKSKVRTFVVLGDGETEEGAIWESALCASKHNLSNLTVIIDYNKVQASDFVKKISRLEPMADKWASFGFQVEEINGHDVNALKDVFNKLPLDKNRPTAIICHTVKGKGIPFAEYSAKWHYKRVDEETIEKMYAALGGR